MTNTPSVSSLSDPLSELARKERRNLLAASTLGIAIAKVGLVPEKISALGIDFSSTNKGALLLLLVGLVVYFLLSFLIYGLADFARWRREVLSSELDVIQDIRHPKKATLAATDRVVQPGSEPMEKVAQKLIDVRMAEMNTWNRVSRPIAILRGLFDFVIPPVLSAWATWSLVASFCALTKVGGQ